MRLPVQQSQPVRDDQNATLDPTNENHSGLAMLRFSDPLLLTLPHQFTRRMLDTLSEEQSRLAPRLTPWMASLQRQAATVSPMAGRSVEQAMQWAGLGESEAEQALAQVETTSCSPWTGTAQRQLRGLQPLSPVVPPRLNLQACWHYVQSQNLQRTLDRYPSLRTHIDPEVLEREPVRSPFGPLRQKLQRLRTQQQQLQKNLERRVGLRSDSAGGLEFPEDL